MTGPLVRLNPPELWDATQRHHSQGTLVDARKLAFCSDQIAAQKGVDREPESLREQTEVVCRNLQTCLDSIGGAPADNDSLRAYIFDRSPNKATEVFPELIAFLGEAMPAMTGLAVGALFSADLKIEIDMVALAPGDG